MKHPSAKGSAFERQICKSLSLWWTQNLAAPRDDIFWRTSQSGGRATTRAKQNIETAYSHGDITFIDPIGKPFISKCLLELKRGYTAEINLLDLLDRTKGNSPLISWWDKAEKEKYLAKRNNTIIIFKRNHRQQCILLDHFLFKDLCSWFGSPDSSIITISTEKYKLVALLLNSFLDWCSPDFFRIGAF